MAQERSAGSQNKSDKLILENDSPEELLKVACYLASHGKQKEAEITIRRSLSKRDNNPIAWAILSAILLAQGRETDAEQAGKKAIAQCKGLKMTWPKMRSILFANGIIRGSSWKDPRRVVIEATATTEWGNLLLTLGTASEQMLDEISSSQETLDDKEESQSLTKSSKEYTPTRELELTEKKKYESAGKRFQKPEDREDEQEYELKSMREYQPTKKSDIPEKMYDISEKKESEIIPPQVESPEMLFAAAEDLLKRGDVKKAEEALVKGLTVNPSNGDAWLSLSSLRIKRYKYDEALAALKNATDIMPSNSAAWYQLGYCYQKLNKWSEAIQPIKNAIKIDQNNADFWMALGLSEFHLGQIETSGRSLLRVLRIFPNHKNALFYLAMCMERQGNRKHALSLYLKLLNLAGLTHSMLLRMATAFDRLNRPREAREARRKAELVRLDSKR